MTDGSRLFTCGDIHGCLRELEMGLAKIGFDKSKDVLWALGDLVDRGPNSPEILRLLREPWFNSIIGNHEEIMIRANLGQPDYVSSHKKHGGLWFYELPQEERDEMVALVEHLPVCQTLITPSGRRIGLAHADAPHWDWDWIVAHQNDPYVQRDIMWSRRRIEALANGRMAWSVNNIDHVYFGHSIVEEPITVKNMSWIDTGCYRAGVLTIVELE